MKLIIDMNNLEVSNREVLELLENKLRFNYKDYCIIDGVVKLKNFNSWDGYTFIKTDIPVDLYEAFCTIYEYLIKEKQ